MTRAEKLEAAGAFMHCTCPIDEHGERERGFIDTFDEDGCPVRSWYHLTNPSCALHGDNAQPAPF